MKSASRFSCKGGGIIKMRKTYKDYIFKNKMQELERSDSDV